MNNKIVKCGAALAILAAFARPARAQSGDGAAVFQRACASCHASPAADSRAPSREILRQYIPEAVVMALTAGSMRTQGEKLSEGDRRAVAEFLTDKSGGMPPTTMTIGRCTSPAPMSDLTKGPRWNG